MRKFKSLYLSPICPKGKNPFEQIFWAIMLGDFASYYLAKMTGVDMMPVRRIDYLKEKLAQTLKKHLTASI